MNKMKKASIAALSALMLSTAVLPTLANAQSAEKLDQDVFVLDEFEFDAEMLEELEQVDFQFLLQGIGKDLGINNRLPNLGGTIAFPVDDGIVTAQGIKGQAAKAAAKQMMKKLKGIGQKAWDESVKEWVDKIPLINNKTKKALRYWLGYKIAWKTLDILLGVEGTAEDGIRYALKKVGVTGWMADVIARGLVFFLL
ncbi:hypothetical protein [Shouchella lonarensis]|uniref:Antimicrobial peptide, SdpC family n=1 Tax=Shouchella lonarensis TaxID=1464122 RepID=A0A1G6KNP8_9BACI|nr:hypothetical protein [Shouchella lonarensis]SDC32699.1 hypothetical protein SAMN05421737_107100 [Shouchella lonarensis]